MIISDTYDRIHDKFLELSKEAIQTCKSGNLVQGLRLYESALSLQINDQALLSPIYSQLGNTYSILKDYKKSIYYHRKDLEACQNSSDINGEGVANINLGNSLYIIGEYDEAIQCFKSFLRVSVALKKDKTHSNAMYNLGKAYHEKAKHLGAITRQGSGQFPPETEDLLEQAERCYESSLQLSRELEDLHLQSAVLTNLGNVHYLLGNFRKAINLHSEKIKLSKDLRDLKGEMKGYINRGNSLMIMESVEQAINDFNVALSLAKVVGDAERERKMCYTLSNSHFILNQYAIAAIYLNDFLKLSVECNDKFGEARAYMCLTNIHCQSGKYEEARLAAEEHLKVAEEMMDDSECEIARSNMSMIKEILTFNNDSFNRQLSNRYKTKVVETGHIWGHEMYVPTLLKQRSLKISEDRTKNQTPAYRGSLQSLISKYNSSTKMAISKEVVVEVKKVELKRGPSLIQDAFINRLSGVDYQRMNDQRVSFNVARTSDNRSDNKSSVESKINRKGSHEEEIEDLKMFKMLTVSGQINDQRAVPP